MAGLLTRAIGGIAKGVGEGMIQQAKDAREQALLQWTRGNQVADRDASFAHQDSSQAKLFGHEDTSQKAGFDHADTTLATTEAGADRRLGVSETGANARNAASIAGSAANTDKTIAANKETAATSAAQFSDVKPQADGSYVGINKAGQAIPITDSTGKPIVSANDKVPPSVSAGLLKAHTTIDPDTSLPVVDMPAYLADMQAAQKQYSHQPDASPFSGGYLARNPAGATDGSVGPAQIPGGGGLTSGLFGKSSPVLDQQYPTAPAGAVEMLRKNPKLQSDFDQKYGQGAASRALAK